MTRLDKEDELKAFISIIQNGEDEYETEVAMLEVLRRFEPFRKSLTKKFAGKGVPFDDICQVIDLKLIEAMYDYDESLDPSAIRHITSKARNGIWNFYRKEMLYFDDDRKVVSLDGLTVGVHNNGDITYVEDSYSYEYSTYDTGFNEETIVEKIMLKEGLKSLTNHQRELVQMYYWSDMTQDEIAEELQIHQTNVSRATKRGVKKLRESLNPLGEHDDKR